MSHDIVELTVEDIAHGGACVGRADDGRVAFIRFALPGEHVRAAVTASRSTLLRGDALEVLDHPSEHRVDHEWSEAGPLGVGGADLGHVDFAWQAEWKTQVLTSTIRRIGTQLLTDHLAEQGVRPQVRAFAADEARGGWHTRTRIEMTIGPSGRPGMYREASHDLVELSSMPHAVEELEELEVLSGAFAAPEGTRLKAVAPSGSAPLVLLGGQAYSAPQWPTSPFIREDVVVDGQLYTYRVRASGFWQVHRDGAAELIRLVLRAADVERGERVLELYSGAGLLTQPLAHAVGPRGGVLALEGVRTAVEDARANLRDVEWAASRTARIDARTVEDASSLVVADPPRAGLGLETARALAASKARRIVLVSCDAASMARDVAAMVREGRRVVCLESIDMFPNTHHFETVTALV